MSAPDDQRLLDFHEIHDLIGPWSEHIQCPAPDAIIACWAPDGVLHLGGDESHRGHAEIRELFEDQFGL